MKELLFGAVIGIAMFASTMAIAGEQTIKLSVPGMTCASCPYIVKKSISAIDGVNAVEATMDDLSATVTFEDTIANIEMIREATAGVGYPSTVIEDNNS